MIKKEEVKHIAKLSRINLTKEEEQRMEKDLSSILDYFESLKKADVSDVKESFGVSRLSNVLRQDAKEEHDIREKLLKLVPETKDNFIKVKSVF